MAIGLVRQAVFALLCCAAGVTAVPAQAQTRPQQTHHFSIPAQPADTAIDAIGRQGSLQIVASRRVLAGKRTNPVEGNLTPREALDRLLDNTGLQARQTGPQIFIIVAAEMRPRRAPRLPDQPHKSDHPYRQLLPAQSPVKTLDIQPIIVTGSLVIAHDNRSPTPVTTMAVDDRLAIRPGGLIEGLDGLPSLQGSIDLTSNVNSGGYNMLNLRGLGSTRGLILIDGRRVGSTQTTGQVDVDVLPQILLRRVDVVTGGASAAYGSDAVSGVVNFITDTDFTGLKVDMRSGISRYGDDAKHGVGAAWGRRFAQERGHVELGYEYSDNAGFERSSRPFFSPWASLVGSGTAASPYTLARGATLNSASFGGLINSGALSGLQFARNGTLTAFDPGTPTATSGVNIGGDGAYFTGSSAGAAQVANRAMARLDYRFNDRLGAHVSGIFSKFKQSYTLQNPLFSAVSIGYDNPYLANLQPAYQAIVAAQPAGSSFQFSKLDAGLPNYQITARETYLNLDAGLNGKLGGLDWAADTYRTESHQTQRNNNGINLAHFYAAINAVSDGSGHAVCQAALTNPTYANCVPLNLFGVGSEQAAAIAYIEQPLISTQHFVTTDANVSLRGPIFALPAGTVKMAVMGEWRRSSYDVISNASPADAMDCQGIAFNCTGPLASLRYLGGAVAALAPVSQTVIEQALEVEAPLLAYHRFARVLTLNGAVRHTHYDTSGAAWTWKGGLLWETGHGLTLRMTRSRDIRAPNLYDLYSPQSVAVNNYTDLHTNTSGLVAQVLQGNPALKPEKADTLTVGAVFAPRFLPGFSLTVDYYNIRIRQALVNIPAFQPATQAACEASGGISPFCAYYIRPHGFADTSPANYPTLLISKTLNVAALSTQGLDIETHYNTRLAGRALSMRGLVTWQPTLRYDNSTGNIVDVGGAADGVGGLPPLPAVRVTASMNYALSSTLGVTLQQRWRSALRQHGNPDLVFAYGDVPAIGYTDLALRCTIDRHLEANVSVQNVFNAWPPVYASAGGSTQMNYLGGYAQGDDIEGRYVTLSLRLRF
ncbi:TonB-dependent receptor [Novosphingobium rosa]|uniref:TonB-dependent receptor n=1 Tax=Novosphingobium rosa TaxID=76978 RepID=UPI00082B5830|nr:TonB-dependent receptor [Novosphingobium rosa]